MLHAKKSKCFLSDYFPSLKLWSPLFMAAVVSIFSQEQIQGLGFFFAYFWYCVWRFHTLGRGLVFTPNYVFRHRKMSASSHFWLQLIFWEMIKYQRILIVILKNPPISNSKLHPYNTLVKNFCKTENEESKGCLTNRPNLFVYYYYDDYYNIACFRINLVER